MDGIVVCKVCIRGHTRHDNTFMMLTLIFTVTDHNRFCIGMTVSILCGLKSRLKMEWHLACNCY